MWRGLVLSLCVIGIFALPGCKYLEDPTPEPTVRMGEPRAPMFQQQGTVPPPQTASASPVPQTSAPVNLPQASGASIRVGLLVPMSGPSADLGQNLLDAGMLALFDKYSGNQTLPVQVMLLPKDTQGTAQGAALAAKQAIDEGASLLIGPVFSEEVKSASEVARKSNIPLVTFSNNRANAASGVYLFGFMPGQSVTRVMQESYRNKLDKIGVLVPDNEYGRLVEESARQASTIEGKELVGVVKYPPGTENISLYVERLLGGRVRTGEEPTVNAVLLAEGGSAVRNMAAALYNIAGRPVRLLGTGLWDDPSVVGSRELAGGWFATSPLRQSKGFEQRFSNYYGYAPLRLASLAYDAVALATTLATLPTGPDFSAGRIADVNGYNGPANGIFRFNSDGTVERGLAVLEITPAGFQQVSPAPSAFLGN